MSVRTSAFYGDADGSHWHAWSNGMRERSGVFVEVSQAGEVNHQTAGSVAIAKWVENERRCDIERAARSAASAI